MSLLNKILGRKPSKNPDNDLQVQYFIHKASVDVAHIMVNNYIEAGYNLDSLPAYSAFSSICDICETTGQIDMAFHFARLAEMQGWKDFNSASFSKRVDKYHDINPLLAADFFKNSGVFPPYMVWLSIGYENERKGSLESAMDAYIEACSFMRHGDTTHNDCMNRIQQKILG